ncbi:MAG: acetyl-CoA carboxylase biotin carboxylase subunit [Betaproteobacteria bacterium]|nr:acetyl-CoA carboxylase biotin carboxylase subunit [Betaproteobacteria bacterium]
MSFQRVFIANRGEIAVRVVRACDKLGIESVVAVSEADRDSLAARMATRVVCIGPARASESYLRPEILVAAALGTGCEAVHPGYGFLSERAAFSRLCAEVGLVFIGPSPEAIESMGDKITALRLAAQAGVPRVPGSDGIATPDDARRAARLIGYPVLLKASAGGGGRGMRIVRAESAMGAAIEAAAAEALAAFGDPTLYLEKFIELARHVEIQVLGDAHGNVVHLGERECSTQRRHQKLIEEAPSPAIDATMRAELGEAAVTLARRVKYQGAGTVEFVFDEAGRRYYFLEMNTRIQVEHPVTEMVTGRDLVSEQIRIAAGEPISFGQDAVCMEGHAIECRINAEDADRDFAPSPGCLLAWAPPEGENVRVDTHCFPGYEVPPFYDSLLAKLIVRGPDRTAAIERMREALGRFVVDGVHTTIPFHRRVLAHDDFRAGRVTTRWVEEKFLGGA